MEINKQLFEDVFSGKLKGTFVLRNGSKISSSKLSIYTKDFSYPILLNEKWYTYQGEFDLVRGNHSVDIINFIPDTDMKENELTIEIPDGKIVDWDESKKQNKIVLKDKQLTYGDICEKLFKNCLYFINERGKIELNDNVNKWMKYDANNADSKHQLECILAKNKLANVAKYLNNGWKPNKGDFVFFLTHWTYLSVGMYNFENYGNQIIFKNREVAQQAVEILGEETVKLALESLGI